MAFVSIDTSEVRALARDIIAHAERAPARVGVAVTKCGFKTVTFAQAAAPVDIGALKSSIGVDIDGLSFEAGPTVEYGAYIELGTGLWGPSASEYEIRNPFGWGPDVTVWHPGVEPQPYLGPGFDKAVNASMSDFADAAGDVW